MTSEQIALWYDYVYSLADAKYPDCPEKDDLVQETMLAAVQNIEKGQTIDFPKAFLATVLSRKYNQWLRSKYKNRTDYPDVEFWGQIPEEDVHEEKLADGELYEKVRREIGRLTELYRESVIRYYVKGQTVDKIASELGVPKGTVLSRLSHGRKLVKEGLTHMENYSEMSYAPKSVRIGIWGGSNGRGEPFSLVPHGYCIEANLLVAAYEKPISVREAAGTLGMPCAYLEPIVEKLVKGELMGRTSGGLVYTRCFMQKYRDTFGNVRAQEEYAGSAAKELWELFWEYHKPLMELPQVASMNEKQKATLLLALLNKRIGDLTSFMEEECKVSLPERPGGARWLATVSVFEHGESTFAKYDGSGPYFSAKFEEDGSAPFRSIDYQSIFGDTHWCYGDYGVENIQHLLLSLLPSDVSVIQKSDYESIPMLEKLHILRRGEDGSAWPDVPALPLELFDNWVFARSDRLQELNRRMIARFAPDLRKLNQMTVNRVPAHVDCAEYYRHNGGLGCYIMAQMLAIVEAGLLPYPVEVGKTPIILLGYQPKKG